MKLINSATVHLKRQYKYYWSIIIFLFAISNYSDKGPTGKKNSEASCYAKTFIRIGYIEFVSIILLIWTPMCLIYFWELNMS